ncbi:class I adenylate-forming enzyme family protein [Aliiroseovarius sp. PTFE2010]|uniref:class I adenylate-forming enzyme family protein n=1 Tax=Aliiroseovarius sp. PTFE2010 TaxID=3417190 RepID=UPI003CEA3649
MLSVIAPEQLRDPAPQSFNMARYVLAAGQATPDKPALIIAGNRREVWSYAELTRATRGLGTALLDQGLTPGDRVLMRLGNTVEFPLTYLAAIAVGLIPVPTSPMLTGPEVTKIADEISPALVVADTGIALPSQDIPVLGADALHDLHQRPPCDWHMGAPDRPAYIIYTSGTSGAARAVTHAHRAIWARRMMHDGWFGLTPSDRVLHAGAFNWTYTLGTGLMDPWALGATAVIPAVGTASTDLPALLARDAATIFAATPGVYRQMLRADMPDLPSLRHGLSAGEKLPAAIRARWSAATGTAIYEAFGMSECSTFVSGAPSRPAPEGALGYAQEGRYVAVLSPDGVPVRRGMGGTLAVHRSDPGLMLGYWGAPEATEARFHGDWFVTGDQVSMAEDGAITYLGRDDDMMNAGGFRVSPVEVEAVFTAHPDIHECAAVEQPVKADTTAVCLYYTADAPLAEASLVSFAASRLARYKTPRVFVHVAALPKNRNGKIQRRALRKAL